MASIKPSIRRRQWAALAVALTAQFSVGLSAGVIPPLGPVLQADLGLTKTEVGLFSSALYVGSWTLLLMAGSVTDHFGARRMLSLGQLFLGSILMSMAAAGSFVHAVVIMFGAGLGRASVLPGVSKAIVDWFPPRARGTVMGIKQTAVPMGSIATAFAMPALAIAFGWRFAIAAAGAAVVAGSLLAWALYRDAGLSEGELAHRPGMVAALKEVTRNRGLWVVGIMAALLGAVQLALMTYLPLYFYESILLPWVPDDPTRLVVAGGYLAVGQAGGILGRVLWGVVSDRILGGRRRILLTAIGLASAVLSLVVSYLAVGLPAWALTVLVFSFGITAIGWNGLEHVLMVETAGRGYAATGVGFCMSVSQLGSMVGAPAFGFILDVTHSYHAAWLLLGCVATVAAVVALVDSRRENRTA